MEATSLSSLIRDDEKESNRKSASHAFSTVASILQRMVGHPVRDSTDTRLCKIVQISMERALEEHERNAAGVCISNDVFGSSYNLSIMLLEAAANACNLDYSMSAVPEATSGIEQCKIVLHDLTEKIGASLSVLRGRSIGEIRSLGDANVFSYITGLIADAQLLLEDIGVHSLPNPELHGELLNNVRKTLCEAAAICIKQQYAGNPEYSVPAECDCANPQEWDFPSTNVAAASLSPVVASKGYYIV
ncbi:hypothetical protein ANAPRD1_01136 [Anaplasma phagocytophilum]|uniref:hypothetical protein n=1 Tax=Anaplasma phagocytophilum TaxID=948 RepID=UPI0007E1CB6A|nr:hypothetical protein [Anaplasma phagocytophilum]SCV61819.1 hypothetical protein ANAPH2_00093 [Anaplasma phagocytophilum]SCV66561.1 hypothetical protein ANAPRD1_01136 [Anaplasma phagocytophilum]